MVVLVLHLALLELLLHAAVVAVGLYILVTEIRGLLVLVVMVVFLAVREE
jgi:hypothetical protein